MKKTSRRLSKHEQARWKAGMLASIAWRVRSQTVGLSYARRVLRGIGLSGAEADEMLQQWTREAEDQGYDLQP